MLRANRRVLAVLGVLGVLAARHPMKSHAGGPPTASGIWAHLRFSPMRIGIWKQPRQLSRTTLSCGRTLNIRNRGSLRIGKWARARRCACREAIRLGEREARTAKQPQGPAPARQRQVVSNKLFPFYGRRCTELRRCAPGLTIPISDLASGESMFSADWNPLMPQLP